MEVYINPDRSKWNELLRRPAFDSALTGERVNIILKAVKTEGDTALYKLNQELDGATDKNLSVGDDEFEKAGSQVSDDLKRAIDNARRNIEKFHRSQRVEETVVETSAGIQCWRRPVPIEKIGLYIPGGSAPLFSTLLMLAVPARIAGCKEIIVCSPAKNNIVHPVLLYTASLLGIRSFFRVGGAQAIGAMAYGTETIPSVYKIFGPGNRYVMSAKQQVNAEGVAIDMPAGPSEVAVFADESADPGFVAADLLGQAEHGPDSQVILVSTGSEVVERVLKSLEKQLPGLERQKELQSSISLSKSFVLKDADDCFDLLNTYAPEHLIIASDRASELANRVINAGSVFLGHYSPESAGDYISGTNHTLPTNGFARAYSGVSLDSFLKKITFQKISPSGLKAVAEDIGAMATAEGLTAHKNAVDIRINKLNNEL